jgi:hypothetical protein
MTCKESGHASETVGCISTGLRGFEMSWLVGIT